MQIENIMEIFYSRDMQRIKEVLTPIIKNCKMNNETNILLGDFRLDFEELTVMYTNLDGCIEFSKIGILKKTDKIIDTQTFAITSEKKDSYENETPLIKTISSIETLEDEIYETHHIEVINSNMLASEIIKDLEYMDMDNESKALISRKVQKTDKVGYVESYLNSEYLQPVKYNDETNTYELIHLTREDKICDDYVLSFIEEEIIISIIYKVMLEILINV